MDNRIGVAILGGTGYGAGELLRLLTFHDEAEVVSVVSSSQAGKAVTDSHSFLRGFYDLKFDAELNLERLSGFSRFVVFAALPHGVSAVEVPRVWDQISKLGGKIIDLSGDYRLSDEDEHKVFYGTTERSNEFQKLCVYGLPELNRERIRSASAISNPGCLASACILTALPFMERISGSVVFDAKTGISGAGRIPSDVSHLPHRHASMQAYKVLSHRHEPEIRQCLLQGSKAEDFQSFFVPHLLPATRGIYVTSYITLLSEHSEGELFEMAKQSYDGHPFVRLIDKAPELRDVVGTNYFDMSLFVRGRQLVVIGALDNMGKGMAGVAIQNMNLLFGLDETKGLLQPSMGLI